MRSSPASGLPSAVSDRFLPKEFQGNVLRGSKVDPSKHPAVQKFYDAVQEITPKSKLGTQAMAEDIERFLRIAHRDVLEGWLSSLEHVTSPSQQTGRYLVSQQLSTSSTAFKASIHLESANTKDPAGSIRAFGEYHQAGASINPEDDGNLLQFFERVRNVFKAEPARFYLHAFLIHDNMLELWIVDRSGAYSMGRLDIAACPNLLVASLAGYTVMSDKELGFNTFIRRSKSEAQSYVAFNQVDKLYLKAALIASPAYVIGLGTTCYAASTSITGEPSIVVKFSWHEDATPAEVGLLQLAQERNVWGVVRLVGSQNLVSIDQIREGLQFPRPAINRTLSCVATTPLGRPMSKFNSIQELLEVFSDLVKALRSLYVDGRMLHRDVAIKNAVITSQYGADSPKGVLIDFDQALDLDHARPVEPMVGSDGFMAIGILSGKPHTYRHDLESLFYMFLWFAIGNDHEHDDANEILLGLPETSRLRKWCSMDFRSVGQAKTADMGSDGFLEILGEFSEDFAPLKSLAKELHALIFPIRDGEIFIGTETDSGAIEKLYQGMIDAFDQATVLLG